MQGGLRTTCRARFVTLAQHAAMRSSWLPHRGVNAWWFEVSQACLHLPSRGCAWLQPCLWTLWNFGPSRCLMSCQYTWCLSCCHMNLPFCVHLGIRTPVGACVLMSVCLTVKKIKGKSYVCPHPRLTSLSLPCTQQDSCYAISSLLQGIRACLPFLSPPVYTIPRKSLARGL